MTLRRLEHLHGSVAGMPEKVHHGHKSPIEDGGSRLMELGH